MICVSIAHISFSELKPKLHEFEMLELRLDLLDFSEDEYKYIINKQKPIIATFRYGDVSDKIRIDALKKAIQQGADYVDIEIDAKPEFVKTMMDFAKQNNCQTILSYHNFENTPNLKTLNQLIKSSKELGADYIKIATLANSKNDVTRTLSLYENNENLLAFNMGKLGKISRISSLFLGAKFSYAALSNQQATASGQMDYLTLKKLITLIK